MRHSLTLKLAVAFLVVGVIGAALAAGLARWITAAEFGSLVLDQAQSDFAADAAAYYRENGSWRGVAAHFGPAPSGQAPPEGAAPGQAPPRAAAQPPFSFALVDQNRIVHVPSGPYRVGDAVPAATVEQGIEIEVDGLVVGVVLATGETPELTPRELEFVARIDRALLYAALGAIVIALALGLLLARTLTRPLRELTAATRAMAGGDLEQLVAVRSRDELGELAAAFNRMSAGLARANRARRQMTADVAHDLRTPLTVIKGYAEALRDGDLPSTPGTFEAIYREAEHLNRLVEDLRTLSLVDAGELVLERQRLGPGDLLERAAAAHLPLARQADVALDVDAAPDLPPVHVDPERIARVLGNLIGNALRYTSGGGRITLSARRCEGGVALAVEDTGAGIDPADLPHVFDRFYRGDDARAAGEGASGLGLAIARSLVEAHGGAVSVISKVGEGTTFVITLPGE